MSATKAFRVLSIASALWTAELAHADGLADLRSALARLQAQSPFKATLDVSTDERHGAGAEALHKQGDVQLGVEDGVRGLAVTYSRQLLQRIESEQRETALDSKAKTPVITALDKFTSSAIAPLVSAAPVLSRSLDDSQYKGEASDSWNGKPARKLTFNVPVTKVPEQQRRYVKEFEGTFVVWISGDGTPLGSLTRTQLKGRAFVVVSFDAIEEDKSTYGVVGDRLLTLRSEEHALSNGAGEHDEQRVVKTLQVQQ